MTTAALDRRVDAVRAFTRSYTSVLALLDEGLLDTPYSVTEARVIFELGRAEATDGTDATALRRTLRIDAGYLSRILGRFDADGLLTRTRSGSDARRAVLRLTARGRAVFDTLDGRSAAQVRDLLVDLGEADQQRLVTAMDTVREILGEPPRRPRTVVLRQAGPGDFGWVISRHGALYATEYGWDSSFEALVARIVAEFIDGHDPAREAAWLAEIDGDPAGCVFCVAKDETTAQLRILLVEPSARGIGIGSRLVEECLRFARAAGYRRIELWTNDVLKSARRIYEAAGFTLVDEQPHHSFGKDLVGQTWARRL